MKVLWFSNTPASGSDHIKVKVPGGGWLKSLDEEIQTRVDLHIAFHYPKGLIPFEYGNTHYYPITVKNWRLGLIRDILFNTVYDQDFQEEYLSLIRDLKPDIIHIHGTENPFGCIIERVDIPVVVSIQGNITVITHKYLSGLSSDLLKVNTLNPGNGLKSMLLSKSFGSDYRKHKKMTLIESRSLAVCKFIIGRTDWDRRVTSILAPASRYFHNDEILKEEFYTNLWSKKRGQSIVIHSTSGNCFYKGFETICQSLHALNKSGISVNWQVAGIKDSDLIVKIVKKNLGRAFPRKGLLLLGHMNETELIKRMLEADIFVMASHIENSSNSLGEAMLLGMPCIATCAGGTGSLLKDGEDGILLQDGDPWVMAGAIVELARDPEKSYMLGENARKAALKRHNKERIIKDLINIYTEIIKS